MMRGSGEISMILVVFFEKISDLTSRGLLYEALFLQSPGGERHSKAGLYRRRDFRPLREGLEKHHRREGGKNFSKRRLRAGLALEKNEADPRVEEESEQERRRRRPRKCIHERSIPPKRGGKGA